MYMVNSHLTNCFFFLDRASSTQVHRLAVSVSVVIRTASMELPPTVTGLVQEIRPRCAAVPGPTRCGGWVRIGIGNLLMFGRFKGRLEEFSRFQS